MSDLGSLADIAQRNSRVHFTPESGHQEFDGGYVMESLFFSKLFYSHYFTNAVGGK